MNESKVSILVARTDKRI